MAYEYSLKIARDVRNTLAYATEEAIKKGEIKGRQEGGIKGIEIGMEKGSKQKAEKIALTLLQLGQSLETVALATELSLDEIKKIDSASK